MKRRLFYVAVGLFALYVACSVLSGIFLAEVALHPGRRPVLHEREAQQIAADMHAQLSDVTIAAADGTPLAAWFAQPAQWNGDAVILLHGVSDNREGVGGFARLFLQHGYSVLLPDARAHGQSGGQLASYGLREAGDVHTWTDWLYAKQSPACVYGFGESMGAGIIVQSVKTEPRLCGVVAESAFGDFHEAAFDRIADKLDLTPSIAKLIFTPSVDIGFAYARWKYGVDMRQVSPAGAVRGSLVPVFLIHGLADVNLRPRESRLIQAANPAHVSLWLVPGAHHCGASAVAPEEFRTRVLQFLSAHEHTRPAQS